MNEGFTVSTQQFQGPLEVLLGLIQDRKLYVNELSLAEVTDAYLSYVQSLPAIPLAETSQFVLVASTLLLIKSRSLLPQLELTDEEEGNIHELTSRLAHYQKIKEVAKVLSAQWSTDHMRFPVKAPVEPTISFRPGESSIASIHRALVSLTELLPAATFRQVASVVKTVSLEEVIESVRTRMMRAVSSMRFKDFVHGKPKHEVILHFLALLELVKGGVLSVEQSRTFDDIMLDTERVSTPRYGV